MTHQATPWGQNFSTPVQALPSTHPEEPGLWVVSTKSATRYVIVTPPWGCPLVTRVSYHGPNFTLTPLIAARAHGVGELVDGPLRTGAEGVITYGESGQQIRCAEVTAIDSYSRHALLRYDRVRDFAEAMMRRDLVHKIRDAIKAGRITTRQDLERVCLDVGLDIGYVEEFM
ncbi:hypothetical protein K8Z61_12640 [Nocardioides sp. TRM66260-LWL]|uniref:hypothetical protein n=1 Tax=Nocardioides sp. TRM66260-LWL TaxID=2874478 RepID=UPI001CC4EE33|nr:hypothetical protein [Nocardioides sp. TRM66260-LWL]MBZ5735344.1 hypothetical protein [Nocardioides sp. TRM66260-LWL]